MKVFAFHTPHEARNFFNKDGLLKTMTSPFNHKRFDTCQRMSCRMEEEKSELQMWLWSTCEI